MHRAAITSASLLLLSVVHASTVQTNLHIVNAEISPDGFTRDAVLAEGVFPGPLITGNKGDNFQLNIINELTDNNGMKLSTSIHWHGFFQKTTNWADGPAFVNQCPIAANNSFLYNFDVPDQAGTFWYHSHYGVQYCDGLRGAFVVYDPNDPLADMYDIDDETTVITLADWYHIPSGDEGTFPIPDSVLVNGLGQYIDGPDSPLSVINVQQGKRYRMRLVSISCEPSFIFSIDGHNMTVIEADGVELEPLLVDSITIFAAQRYSFILDANQPVNNYWIRSLPDAAALSTPSSDLGVNAAILRYSGAPDQNPTTPFLNLSLMPLVETNLHPLDNMGGVPGGPSPGDVDLAINLSVFFNPTTLMFEVNGVTYESASVPVLLQILSGTTNPSQLLPSGSVYALPGNSSIELTIPGGAIGGGHPVHLHGHNFYVVRSAGSSTYNYDNPVIRDVVDIGSVGDNVTIRWVTNNPGPWFLHCHIDWHLNEGFAVVFAEDIPDIASQDPVPQAWSNLCPIYNALSPDQQ